MAYLRKLYGLLKLVLINLTVLVLIFLSLEIAVRGYRATIGEEGFFRENQFISPWITTYDYPPPITKADGKTYFRHQDKPTDRTKPANTVRIITVGGSTTANEKAYKSNKIDYAKALETLLNKDADGVFFEILNAGGNAYSTAQSVINIAFRLVEYQPDIIVLMHNINDSSVNSFQQGAAPDYANKYIQPYYLNPQLQGSLSLAGFLIQSRLLTRLGLTKLLLDKNEDLNVNNDITYGLQLFKRNLATIASICKLHGIDLVLLSQPYTMEPHRYIKEAGFLAYNEAIAEVAAEQAVAFVDMFSLLGHDKKHFVDEFHYSPAGITRFSEMLYPRLREIILKRLKHHDAVSGKS